MALKIGEKAAPRKKRKNSIFKRVINIMKKSIRAKRIEKIRRLASEEGEHSYMAKPQLFKIESMARELNDMISEGETLPDWVESHIAKCEQMLQSVHGKVSYEKRNEEI
jgi:hypothetical protein